MELRLRRTQRMQCAYEFDGVFKRGRCFRATCLRVHYRPNGRELTRLGLVVSRRLGKAVERNRIKRHLREIFRAHQRRFPEPLDIVLVPQRGCSSGELRAAFLEFAGQAARAAGGRRP